MGDNFDKTITNFQKSLFTDVDSSPEAQSGIRRKYLSQTYTSSLNTFDEQTTNLLLESWFSSNELQDSKKTNDRVKNILLAHKIQTPVQLQSGLDKIDLQSILTRPPCFDSEVFACSGSEDISSSDFKKFTDCLQKNESEILSKNSVTGKTVFPRNNSFKSAMTKTVLSRNNSEEGESSKSGLFGFKSALSEVDSQQLKKISNNVQNGNNSASQKTDYRRNVNSKFKPPFATNKSTEEPKLDDRLKNIDPKMVELIKSEIMGVGEAVQWGDIAGLEFAKTAIQEAVVWPLLRPDIFTGLRRPPKGILLFGPPGTGKTLIGKCVASQSKSTFFNISASSLTSKWIGDGEKMVRALFAVARCHQPAVIFIDEVDSLLTQRSDSEHESSRRIKTEFLVQLDGASTDNSERMLLIGATNRPQELDEAARRRFVRRLYIPLPGYEARLELLKKLMITEKNSLSPEDLEEIAKLSDGYSGADVQNLCSEAALGPVRSLSFSMIENIQADDMRGLNLEDFLKAFTRIRSSVSPNDLEQYVKWDKTYGSGL